jgi:hypothetical protein
MARIARPTAPEGTVLDKVNGVAAWVVCRNGEAGEVIDATGAVILPRYVSSALVRAHLAVQG